MTGLFTGHAVAILIEV
ncbi:Protein of unknown function [Propionibacterium freudenreichii]|nr:Protein of unknown function [Propionibacterium freudenreichii]CEG96912.1 Protein of unknown function [Propionibacterium freudenreichii]CEH09061.1 Protein of unknown function [Propionibacterium freudenreichii]CEH09371.1 Protein of unknown function [Propionibacterium freudenreichii]CEI28791.1 Protein of unknown function [Propionibacterium freudenreichii]